MFKPLSAAQYRCSLSRDIGLKPRYPKRRGLAELFDGPAHRRAPRTGEAVVFP